MCKKPFATLLGCRSRAAVALLLIPLLAAPAGADVLAPEAPPHDGLSPVLVRLAAPLPAAGATPTLTLRAQRFAIAAVQAAVEEELQGTRHARVRRFAGLPMLALDADADALARLRASSWVASVEPDRLHRLLLDRSVPLIEADRVSVSPFDGGGRAVAVLDTGVDASHPALAGRVVAEACFSRTGDCPGGATWAFGPGAGAPCTYASFCFHGTHVAGIAVSGDSTYSGVAPGADLVAVQVFSRFQGASCAGAGEDPCALAFTSDIVAGLDFVGSLLPSVRVASVNLSLGGGGFSSPSACDVANGSFRMAIDQLRSLGIVTVAAAGNDGVTGQISAPACVSPAVSVGATTLGDTVAGFSNRASFLSFFAPGAGIVSTVPFDRLGTFFASVSGTSMAAPHVAGAIALVAEANPGLDPSLAVEALRRTGRRIAGQTAPRIAVSPALDLLAGPDCSDGLDNDRDGAVDLADPQCTNPTRSTELPVAACGLGFELALVIPLLARLRRRATA